MTFSRLIVALGLLPVALSAQVTSPRQQFGHDIGEDYFLINYAQLVDYWQKLDRQSDRMKLERIGTTAEGRPMWMAIITSPQNHRRLSRYREISERLARAEGITDAQARALAKEGKAIVWIDGGLHASEVLGAQQLVQFVYEMVSRNDAETQRFLRDDILLAVLVNPDGMDLVSNWYMRETDPKKRSLSGLPRLYHKYAGHDNNRDSYMAALPETQAIDSILFRAWYPQIVYNHHQTGPEGSVLFAPPFRDPFNYNYDPLIPVAIDLVGAAIHSRFIAEGKAGATMRNGASFSTWWNGGLRTTVYFHNQIGLLTETFGNPTPSQIALVPERLLPGASTPYPILPQPWHFAQSLAYELSANRAVMDVASKYREDFLYNGYRMGRNSIERGSRDNWTLTPNLVARVRRAVAADSAANPLARRESWEKYVRLLRDPALRDPRAYIVTRNQPDLVTSVRFVNALIKNGITVHRLRSDFSIGEKQYPAGSYVVLTAQAFRPHILDMFEPQNHPDDIPYPGGPPTPPYDNAGWTLAYQMGVRFDRLLDPLPNGAQLEKVKGFAPMPEGGLTEKAAKWYAWPRINNEAFTAVNRLLRAGADVYTVPKFMDVNGSMVSPGNFIVRSDSATEARLKSLAAERGMHFKGFLEPVDTKGMVKLRLPRIALWDQYGGSIASGWLRLIFEQFEFPYDSVFARDLDAGNLRQRYDVIILPDGARLRPDSAVPPTPVNVPREWQHRIGTITESKTLPQLRRFVEEGGTLLALGDAAEIAYQLNLPVTNAVVDSAGKPLPRSRYYVPGSVLQVRIGESPVTWGMSGNIDIFFDNSPVFRFAPGAQARGVRRVAWFDTATPLRSGWAWGQEALKGAVAIATAPLGAGTVILYGPEVYFRSQPHGAFRFLFNGIYFNQSGLR